MSAITLTPNMLHCVRTGLPLGRLPEGLDTVNNALTGGKYTAGMHTGHIRASDTTIEALKAKGVPLKRYWWATDTAKRIAAHNEATLQQHGFTADPSTKTKGQLRNRQYGVYAEPQPTVVENVDVMGILAGMTVVPDVDLSTLERKPVEPTVPAIVMPKPPANVMPSTTELSVKGGFMKYRSRASKAGMTMEAAKAAWASARDAYKQSTQPKVVEATPIAKPEPKPQPKVVQPSANAGKTIRVNADALAATLSALTDACIVSNDGTVFTVQYRA